ncbi:MAG: hypothetical protein CMC48_00695 [Flavobacteriaceae bacterium]|jgi:hypothetical protein|nr:hypothetical protein [Flavobacteriaceae bacterium]|tara:strand:- start:599 stop:805 length:207 start_codon:yes stop_codon:yes gene_type:complete
MKKYVLSFLLVYIPEILNAQCSMCRAVLESEKGMSTAKGINDGILYLMSIPYILVFIVGYMVYRTYKK